MVESKGTSPDNEIMLEVIAADGSQKHVKMGQTVFKLSTLQGASSLTLPLAYADGVHHQSTITVRKTTEDRTLSLSTDMDDVIKRRSLLEQLAYFKAHAHIKSTLAVEANKLAAETLLRVVRKS